MAMIEYLHWESGDWAALIVDGKVVAEGHSIDSFEWQAALQRLGIQVIDTLVPGDDPYSGPFRAADVLEDRRV